MRPKAREGWLGSREERGWGCDTCDRVGRGMPAPRCPACDGYEFYRVALSECPRTGAPCADTHHQLVAGVPAHVRVG